MFKEYKTQSNVEISFKFLKDPLFVEPVFLKRPGRIEALAYVLLITLLIYSLLERRVRETLKHETKPSLIPGKVEIFTPKGRKILESLEFVMAMTTDDPNRRTFVSHYKLPRVVELSGSSLDIYLDVKERKDHFT